MKFHICIFVMDIQYIAKMDLDLKFKMAAMPIYGKNHSNEFYPRTYRPIRLLFCWKHMGHLVI